MSHGQFPQTGVEFLRSIEAAGLSAGLLGFTPWAVMALPRGRKAVVSPSADVRGMRKRLRRMGKGTFLPLSKNSYAKGHSSPNW
jgi:hypothetical protein